MASSYTTVCIILLLHFFQSPGVHGAKLTFQNNCFQRVWPAILGRPRLQSTAFELPCGGSMAVQAPTSWNGHLWGRTGCTFNALGYGHCTTGDCGSGQMECYTNATATTLAQFQLGGPSNFDFYDVSLLNGYNLPLLVESSSGSDQCLSTGCRDDLNRMCPSELRTKGGGACRSACEVFNAPEYCCTGNYSLRSLCKPTNYSRVFKNACPTAFSYRFDDATSVFTCTTGVDYFITFCPGSSARTGNVMPPAESSGPRTSKGKNPTKVIIIVVPLGIAGVIIISIIIYCLQFTRWQPNDKGSKQDIEKQPNYDKGSMQDIEKQPNDKGSMQDIEKFLLQHGSLAPKRFKYSEIKKITKSFKDKLGQGGYGSVYKGILPDGSLVAVKVLIETDSDGEEFINEVASISRISHVNIVSLSGFCYEKNKRALVYEFMPNKSLDKFLSNDGSTSDADCGLDLEKLCKIAVGVAKGLEYLHTGCNTRIVHFDIKPQNILFDEDFCPKISDFGLAKLCKKKQSVLSVLGRRGTIGYIAPEVFSRTFGGVSHKSDVYSYGMMVLEMAGAKKFVEADANQSSENYFPDKIYEQAILGVPRKLDHFMVEDEAEIAKKLFLVGFWCIQTTPSDRPSISKVVEMLEGSLASIQIPPKPVLFAPAQPGQNISSSLTECVETENSAEG